MGTANPFDSALRKSQTSLFSPHRTSATVGELNRMYTPSFSEMAKRPEFAGYYFKSTPFYVRWVHGYNNRAGAINLNDQGTTTVFYAASNFGVLYNWSTNHMRILQGHRHMVTCISADRKGQWLVTGDSGPDNVIIIWNSKDVFPQRTIFSPHRNLKLAKLALSADAKFLLTVAYGEKAEINWWIWTLGDNIPSATINVSVDKDAVLHASFNPFNTLQFVLMTKSDIWIGAAEKIFVNECGVIKETENYELKIRMPERKNVPDIGRFTYFCFVKTSCQILVSTSRGAVLSYGYSMEYSTDPEASNIANLRYIKAMKVEKYRINVIKSIDGVIVTGNSGGEIHFYDDQMKLVYWVHSFKVDNVKALSFNVSPRAYVMHDPKCINPCDCKCKNIVYTETKEERGIPREKLIKRKIVTDATKAGSPFLVRDFVICTLNQGIGFVDFAREKLNIILNYKISPALSMTVHPEKKLIAIGYLDGNVELVNYTQHQLRMRLNLREFYTIVIPPKDDSIKGDYEVTIPKLSVTCLQYSPSGLHLACGLNTGQLLFFDPTTIDIVTKTPFKDTKFAIKKIGFSADSLTLAFSDDGKTVCVYKYDCESFTWNFIGKHRAHYKDINSIFFLPAKNEDGEYKLLSLGADRVMVEYDIGASAGEELGVLSLDRVDQTAVPLCGIVWPTPQDLDEEECNLNLPIILEANDEHKYKIINYETTMTLATYLGPRYEYPVKDMILISLTDDSQKKGSYLLFATKNVIGLQKMPIDGNPWKHVGMLGHPNQLTTIRFREDSQTLFTIGSKDNCMTQWHANMGAVEKTHKLGGQDLDPYYCLIENGRPGWLFQEVRDLFYYIQILCQGTFSPAMRRVKDYIPVDSLPDLMRALGFFPSEYEVENLLIDAKYKVFRKQPAPEVDFEEFVKLYLNHRPAFLITYKKIKAAYKTFAHYSKRDGDYLKREEFVNVLCKNGECFSKELAWYLLSILYGQSFEDRAASTPEDFSFLPAVIKLSDIQTTIMGIPEQDTEQQSIAMSYTMSYGSATSRDSDSSSDDRFY